MREDIERAAAAVRAGEAVVYPTETVYGLGADALDPAAVERVFELKGRDRDNPLSMGVRSVEAALEHVHPAAATERFMREFLPGPVTVVCPRAGHVPDALTADRDRLGIRVPDHPVALDLLEAAGPLTATSANRSGAGSVVRVGDLADGVREGVGAVVDAGELPGTESTVVDPGRGVVHRRGANADAIAAWLEAEQ